MYLLKCRRIYCGIIVLENGEISGIGTSEELLKTNAIYREVYESQVKGGEDHE